ncbi:MAG: hypothetical protein QG604_249 [Candidatus Dependentiae bacterium]|nr:hypothetical protein [Candidatus Dependentiae bacterium]
MNYTIKTIMILSWLAILCGTIYAITDIAPNSDDISRLIDNQNRFSLLRPPKKPTTPLPFNQPKLPRAEAEWTIVILIQASNNLESFAHKNMKEMMKWGSSNQVNILVDLHKAGDKSWKYRIEPGCCVVEEVSARSTQSTIAEEVIHTAQWAINTYPAKKYAFIFWNHGAGILDPMPEKNKPTYLSALGDNWRTGYLMGTPEDIAQQTTRATQNLIPSDKSILFDDERHTYLSNPDLRTTLQIISTKLLGGKKIDLIGMDACLMGMIEIADQIKEFANYFVASQEFEFAQGWAYGDIIEKLSAHPTAIGGKELGKIIVDTFEQYYISRTSYFTQSCIDLSKIPALKDNVDNLAIALLCGKKQDSTRMKLFIQQARCQSLSFSLSDYIDLHSFYQELLKITQYALDNPSNRSIPMPRIENDLLKNIKVLLTEGIALLKDAVTGNTAGRYLSKASGLSIYFPQKSVDLSYAATEFAQTTSWPALITDQIESRY